jgi:hypothetical protein
MARQNSVGRDTSGLNDCGHAEQKMMLLRHRFHEFLNATHRFDMTKSWALFKDYEVPEEWGGAHPKWVRLFSQGFIMRDK